MKHDRGGLHILDALENLNTLVDADSLEEIEVTDDALLIPHKAQELTEQGHYWVQAGPDEQTLDAIKETFRSVNNYLQNFYSKMKRGGDTRRLVEGINTIMVLVGEAAKNLERFSGIFKKQVSEFDEFKQLQHFYKNRVIKESFREFAKAPIPKEKTKSLQEVLDEPESQEDGQELLEEGVEEIAGVHILNDLDVIRKDHLYELFYLKNEAGNNFFTYELARNIKLACDFGEFSEEYFTADPLLQIKNWEDKTLYLLANSILKHCKRHIDKFYREAMKYKEMEVVAALHNAVMALMMASHSRNLIRQFAVKGCHLYFHDFLLFLRETLLNREYQKFLVYSIPPGKEFFQDMLDLVHALCHYLFILKPDHTELQEAIKHIIEREKYKKNGSLAAVLQRANLSLNDALKRHPNGPVFKAVDLIRDPQWHIFDSLHQGNIPEQEWRLSADDHAIIHLRIPCPILQEFIDRSVVSEEFKTFLRSQDPKDHLLYINFQDRTSWREHARSVAIEDLARHAEFAQGLTVVTLAKDTDFYNQMGFYQDINEAGVFLDHFYQHLNDEITGYYFPPKIKKSLFPRFIKDLLHQIHLTFFEEKPALSLEERLDFIELSYHFVALKLIELTAPTYFCFSSKDALDMGGTASAGFIALLALSRGKKFSDLEKDRLVTLLFGPTLINRERTVHPERFERLLSLITLLETKGEYLKDFSQLFEKETLKWTPNL